MTPHNTLRQDGINAMFDALSALSKLGGVDLEYLKYLCELHNAEYSITCHPLGRDEFIIRCDGKVLRGLLEPRPLFTERSQYINDFLYEGIMSDAHINDIFEAKADLLEEDIDGIETII